MRVFLHTLLLLLSLCIVLLSSCSPALEPSPYGNVFPSAGVVMSTQYPVYDKSIDSITVRIENQSKTEISFGASWSLEVLVDGGWMAVPFQPDTAWIEPLYMVEPGGTYTFTARMANLDYRLKAGEYRIVKEISEEIYTASFTIGESNITAKTPYGYEDVTGLPKNYTAEDAAGDGLVVFYKDGTSANTDKLSRFLQDYVHGIPTQIQMVNEEDSLTVVDLLVNQERPQVRYIHYAPADKTVLTEGYAQYLYKDENIVCVTNSPSTGDPLFVLPPDILHQEWNGKEEALTALETLYQDIFRFVTGAWSADGLRRVWASNDLVMHFYVEITEPDNKGGRGYTVDLLEDKIPQFIEKFTWIDETNVMIKATTKETWETGIYWYGTYDTEAERLVTSSTSLYDPVWANGVLVFQD